MSNLNIAACRSPPYSSNNNGCTGLTVCPGYVRDSAVSLKSYETNHSIDVKRSKQATQDRKAWNEFTRHTSFAIHLFAGIIVAPMFILTVAFLSLIEHAAGILTKPVDR